MKAYTVSFGVNDNSHETILRRDFRFRYHDKPSSCFYSIQYLLNIRIAIKVDQWTVCWGRLVKTTTMDNCTANTGHWIIYGEHPHPDIRRIHRYQRYLKNFFVKFCCSVQVH